MPWLRFTLRTDNAHADAVIEALEAAGAQAVTLVDAEDQPLFEPGPGETPMWTELEATGLFEADIDTKALRQQLATQIPETILATQRLEPLEDKDWSRVWMDDYQPMRFGQRLWIVPSWCEAPEAEAVNILLDPGLAFGTGTHPTTALCMAWLDAQDLQDKTVLDYGCGSGILGVAAAKLGAKSVTAIDIDPQALLATRSNAERNGVSDKIRTGLPHELHDDERFDVVLANILAGPLVELAPSLCQALRPGGLIALSGILQEQAMAVREAYTAYCDMDEPVTEGDWFRLSGTKRS
ncbi:50S ribosomal protein L11 methyltransferase [Sulfuriflexus mobilis]|uniref:50S ribosomal protein L11 methyltransferase n=1 Tax=Sulfuriflexus mobilis TaxID=1811807 RepID=UPI000F82583E|nr:50S ribosomal protein L11 methyltransferase [Sulfuriflexus mobilis]